MGDYPTDDELKRISDWDVQADPLDFLAFVRSIWWNPEWGWDEEDVTPTADDFDRHPYRRFSVSTGGWSGNESLIDAMQESRWLWSAIWYSTRRGGHYEFRVELPR